MSNYRFARLIASGTIGLAGLGAAALIPVAPASATVNSLNINARCSGTSVSNLQVQREDTGMLSVDFGVDMARHRAGVPWSIAETRNGSVVLAISVRTTRDGSFSISSILSPLSGTNTIAGKAVNLKTGETCSIAGSL